MIRQAVEADASGIAAIYDPIVAATSISFEERPPGPHEIACRIASAGESYPWLVETAGEAIAGYAYASRHRERAAYRWSVDVSAYVAPEARRGGVARRLYGELFARLAEIGYRKAFAGIALPNDASVALHRSVGFELIGTYHDVGFKLGAWRDVAWFERRLRADLGEP